MREKELIVYRDFEDGELLYDMAFLMSHYDDEYYNTEDMAAARSAERSSVPSTMRHCMTSAFSRNSMILILHP